MNNSKIIQKAQNSIAEFLLPDMLIVIDVEHHNYLNLNPTKPPI